MVDPETVWRRLREMERRVEALHRARNERAEAGDDEDLQARVERHLQLALQAAIDIAVHIVAEDSSKTPEEYAAAFVMLGEMGVIDATLSGRLADAARLRNILVHAYLEVDPVRLWEAVESLGDLEAFAVVVEHYVADRT